MSVQGIDEQKIPGTVHLVDLEQTLRTRHVRDRQDIVLVPTPSDDPDDPLNWTRRRKLLHTVSWCIYTLVNGICNSNLYAVMVPLSESTGISVSTLNSGTGYLFLLAGWGLLIWQPVAQQYGKRLVYILSIIGLIGTTMWAPWVKGNGQWVGRSVLAGFFASPIEALPEMSITDIYFTHERGYYMSLYSLVLVGSNFIAPVITGFINDGQGWHWVFYWPTIFLGIGLIFIFLFMEETNYDRPTIGIVEAADNSPTTATKRSSDLEKCVQDSPETDSEVSPKVMMNKKTFFKRLSLKDKSRPNMMWPSFKRAISFFTWPVVVYSGFAYGSTLIWFNVLNATASTLLSEAPYNFSTSIVGLSYVSCLVGTLLAFFFVGRLSDWFVVKRARRNKGIMEPEQRLWLFALNTVLTPAALILWGVGAAHRIHWFGLMIAMCLLAFQNAVGASLSVTYVVDCYREVAGEALTTLIIVRNTMSFAIDYGITPWLDNMGTQNCFISAAFIGLAVSLAFLIMLKWGKTFRERSRYSYWQLVRTSIGTAH